MKTIYRNTTYLFYIKVKVNNTLVDISNDVVTVRISKKTNLTSLLSKVADVALYGVNGKAVVEFTPAETNTLASGEYRIQGTWEPDGTTRTFIVLNSFVKVGSRIQ